MTERLKKLENNKGLDFVLKNFWFMIASLIFIALWGWSLGFYPLSNNSAPAQLPTNESLLGLGDGGAIGAKCLYGEVFKTQIIQGDILDCKLIIHDRNPSFIKDGMNVSMILTPDNTWETWPYLDYEKNSNWYINTIKQEDFTHTPSGTYEAHFKTKAPPVSRFTFAYTIPGYYIAAQEGWYTSTALDTYIQSVSRPALFVIELFGVFGAMLSLRDLWRNKR